MFGYRTRIFDCCYASPICYKIPLRWYNCNGTAPLDGAKASSKDDVVYCFVRFVLVLLWRFAPSRAHVIRAGFWRTTWWLLLRPINLCTGDPQAWSHSLIAGYEKWSDCGELYMKTETATVGMARSLSAQWVPWRQDVRRGNSRRMHIFSPFQKFSWTYFSKFVLDLISWKV